MLDPESLLGGISVVGALAIIAVIVFAESGLLIGLFLPGDTLLFTAGFFAASGSLPLWAVIVVIFAAAIAGDNMGYFFGRKTGPKIFHKKEGLLFRREYAERATTFYHKHGGITVLVARFIPYIRTLAPIIAGIGGMNRPKFILYNIMGAFLWTVSFVLFGYWLGVELAERLDDYLVPAFILGLLFAFSPTIIYFIKNVQAHQNLKHKMLRRKQ